MRSSRCSKYTNKKKPCCYKVSKKKNKSYKSKGMWGCNFDISTTYLENINEVLRINKSQQAEGKGSWKIVPKDSCEVYKDRRKRRIDKERDDSNGFCDECLEDDEMINEPSRRKRNVKKKKAERRKSYLIRKKQRYRRDSSVSISSYESFSSSTFTCSSTTDMEDK